MTEYEECPHGRHKGAYCEPCEINKLAWGIQNDYTPEINPYIKTSYDNAFMQEIHDRFGPLSTEWDVFFPEKRQSGLNASYYDFPCKNAQELIEWLELDFSNGNILKSLIRENNPVKQKDTNELYEAEKRYYYAHRHLRSVQKKWAAGGVDSPNVEEGLQGKTKG